MATLLIALLVPTGAAAIVTNTIEGTVTDAGSAEPVEGAIVCAIDTVEFEYSCEETAADGTYLLGNLPDGGYVVEFWAPYLGYLTQFYNGVEAFEDADEVTVSGGATETGIDAALEEGGRIEGRVTDASSGSPIEEVEVCAYPETAASFNCAYTNSAGEYAIGALATDNFYIEFWAPYLGYETRYYDETANPVAASPVPVFAPEATTGIDARLSKVPTPQTFPPASTPPPASTLTPPAHKRRPLRCRKGFKKVKRHGRKVCVKRHKRKRRHHKHRRHHRH